MSSVENPPAFPRDHRHLGHNGMTLRDWFAGQALGWPDTGGLSPSEAAEYAYEYADAMLSQRAAFAATQQEQTS